MKFPSWFQSAIQGRLIRLQRGLGIIPISKIFKLEGGRLLINYCLEWMNTRKQASEGFSEVWVLPSSLIGSRDELILDSSRDGFKDT